MVQTSESNSLESPEGGEGNCYCKIGDFNEKNIVLIITLLQNTSILLGNMKYSMRYCVLDISFQIQKSY